MKHLLIIGARGFGREVYHLAQGCIKGGDKFMVKGFLDDKTDALDNFPGYPPIIDSAENYKIEEDDVFICALGSVHFKKKYAQIILDKGGRFISLVHPTIKIGTNTKIGEGCIIMPDAKISCDIEIGDFVTLQALCNLGHDVKIGAFCIIHSFCFLGGGVELEEEVSVNPGALIISRKRIGKGAIVGAGAVVIRDVKEYTSVFGNPAVRIKP